MQDNISVLLATIVFVILIVLFPIYNVATRNDSMNNNIVIKLTTEFVDDVRNKGYLAADDYYNFIYELGKTGNMYDVELEAHKKVIVKDKSTGLYTEGYEKEFTKEIEKKLNETNTSDTEESIVVSNYYEFSEGDRFYVRVKNTNMTQAQVLMFSLFGGVDENRILVNYGGEVFSQEWERSKLTENISSYIYISRPMNDAGIEYTNKLVEIKADNFDESGETEYVYGIAVPFSSTNNTLKFYLNYTNISEINTLEELENKLHISGFDGDISVDVVDGKQKEQYVITISNISIVGDRSKCQIKIDAGSAKTNSGFVIGAAISPEFILYRSKERFDIDPLQAQQQTPSFDVDAHGYVTKPTGSNPIKIKFTAETEASLGKGDLKYIWTISNVGNKPKKVTPKTGDNITWLNEQNGEGIGVIRTDTNEITVEFDNESQPKIGSYVKVVAVDTSGVYSYQTGVAFSTTYNYLTKGFSTFDVSLTTVPLSGATVDSATFTLTVSSGHGTSGVINNGDRYRIIGTDLFGRKVILIDKTIDWLKKQYGNKIGYDEANDMYFVDYTSNTKAPNGVYDSGEYYVANDITLSGYNTQLGFKTSSWGYPSGSVAQDYSLYYFVYNSLSNLRITVKESAKTKYRNLTFDYKIMAGHAGCLVGSSQKINCTVNTYFDKEGGI